MAGRKVTLGFAILCACGASSVHAELSIVPGAVGQFELTTSSGTGDITPQPAPWTAKKQAPAAKEQTVGSGSPLWAIPIKSLSATRDRPIFSPSRRPPPAVVAAPRIEPPRPAAKPPEPPEQPRLTLLGTVVGESQSIGIFLDDTTKDVVRLKMGEGRRGWDLRSVRGRDVTLEKNSRAIIVALPPPDPAAPQPLAGTSGASVPMSRASAQSADPPLLVPLAVHVGAPNSVDAEPR
jgi:general secretion pathway protein N